VNDAVELGLGFMNLLRVNLIVYVMQLKINCDRSVSLKFFHYCFPLGIYLLMLNL